MASFVPCPRTRVVAVGSGSDGLQEPIFGDAAITLTGKEKPGVLYVGTASYDLPGPQERQTRRFVEVGCAVTALAVADATPTQGEIQSLFESADVILVSGGNTLFAYDRWCRLGMPELFRAAQERGAVLCGGSAGAICWFDGGHSDSMDSTSYKRAMLGKVDSGKDEASQAAAGEEVKKWEYIRVPCLGLLPGLACPHQDRIQSNGVFRADDFDAMLLRHPGETGICIDHWAALVVDGERYQILYAVGKEGSVKGEQFTKAVDGRPGVWRKHVQDGQVQVEFVPNEGKTADLLRPATSIQQDPRLEEARRQNPDDLAA